MVGNKVTKKGRKPDHAEEAFNRRCQKISLERRMCRQMLEQVLGAEHELELPPYAGLTKERVSEMRKAFAKGPIDRNRSKGIVDSRRREAAMADLRRALEYINEKGIKRKQNDDGSYEPGEEEELEDKETIDGEENMEEEVEEDEEEDEEREAEVAGTDEDRQEGQPDSDIEMEDGADQDEEVEGISRGVRRLKLVVYKKE
ncbi:MAG: hypothetical protein HETSPECPRED_008295 [Heterodermia speciosa]|uniref:Uncharacterized protein n=1 Tax=Heterodermia speciosa TaxID=116794 RepID=A0A8H3IU24_9LECA|nr:MAG: hypothetical protein HETSPECPRED_008295 [Heterodermia speciosa]